METAKLVLKKKEEDRMLAGHLWAFSNEIGRIEGNPGLGDIVGLYSAGGIFMGLGFFNQKSLISFRLLTRQQEDTGKEFFKKKISAALEYRKQLYPGQDSFRAVFGESDGVPGLVVDKYGDYLSAQILSAGIEKIRTEIIEALIEVFAPAGIIFRNDSQLRGLEGLELKVEVVHGEIPDAVEIKENGLKFIVNLKLGQKTGFFFDQRDNRLALSKFCEGKTVLDCFSHTGAFGVYAAGAGAKKVTCVDSSMPALESAEKNAKANGLSGVMEFVNGDAGEYLQHLREQSAKYDIIILDPPALIKNKKSFHQGIRLYSKLNEAAMRLLPANGLLATSSCSHHLPRQDFKQMMEDASGKSGAYFKIIEFKGQSLDHPVLLSMPETEYLKFAILRKN